MKKLYILYYIICLILLPNLSAQSGYIIRPVCDLLLKPYASRLGNNHYNLHAASPQKGQYACPRVHQGLFNERVEIIQEIEDEVQIALSNCYHENAFSLDRENHFWTLKTAILSDEELDALDIDASSFPEPIISNQIHKISGLGLAKPWYYKEENLTFSAGTRFASWPEGDTNKKKGIQFFNASKKTTVFTSIDKSYIIDLSTYETWSERKDLFVKIIRSWADSSSTKDAIAYVWGGVSWTQNSSSSFYLAQDQAFKLPIEYWVRSDLKPPISGFDCSGIILRAAQLAGLPYFFKNSTTILHNLRELSKNEEPEEGDIIWCPGHVMVITDIEKNLLVEARGYSGGPGRVIEISLEKRFERLETFSELKEAVLKQIPLINKNQTRPTRFYKIIKLSSLWSK